MADLFDIANLITSVGVEAVKIKSEPGLPEKSSNEILTELFSTFDVDEGIISPQNENCTSEANIKVKSEKKKKKKKHKHKDKRHKKKFKHNSSDSSDRESTGTKKKKKHKKKMKRKHEDSSDKSSDSERAKTKSRRLSNETIVKTESDSLKDDFDILGREDSKLDSTVVEQEPDEEGESPKAKKDEGGGNISPTLPVMSKKGEDDNDEPPVPLLLEKTKHSFQGKILIKDLKNSTFYNETVKEIENREKEKAARMEDGEISDSSEDERTPTLSPSPPCDLKSKSPISSTSLERSKKKSRSPSSRKKIKNDLRLVLKKKHRKRKEAKNKDDKDGKYKNHKEYKNDSKRSHSCQARDKKRSSSQQRSHRSRSRDREKRRGRSRERRERRWSHDRWQEDRSRDKRHYSRHRSRSRERKERIEIDKKRLLEIARRNAINMIKRGALPLAQRDKAIAAIQAGGKTVDELTDFCKTLSKSEALGELSSISSDDGSGSEKGFHHPFLLKERPNSIIMNIRDAKQLPTKTFQEKTAESSNQLRLQFPVSSGQLHRKTESEWVPVPPKKPEPKKQFVPASEPLRSLPAPVPVPPPVPALVPAPEPVKQPSIFPSTAPTDNMDIGSIVSQRLAAMRKLRENPNDVCALNEMYRAQNEMKSWAESKQMPGQFTGSTGVKVLTPAELTSGYQAWARKDQLTSAQPVSGGMGMALLQKMGWRPGEGLGKNKEGTLEPLQLEVKLDKRGLVSDQDIGKKVGKAQKPVVPTIKTLEGKHPVSLLGEFCSKRKLGIPVYELCFECGPDHKKNFLFKVKVNGIEYKPSVASPNKKQAKAEAAQICLQTLGLLAS